MPSPRLSGLLLTAVVCGYAADSTIWKVAPPAPASWQRDRVADLTARRKAIMEQIGAKGILILYAAEPRNYAGDAGTTEEEGAAEELRDAALDYAVAVFQRAAFEARPRSTRGPRSWTCASATSRCRRAR